MTVPRTIALAILIVIAVPAGIVLAACLLLALVGLVTKINPVLGFIVLLLAAAAYYVITNKRPSGFV